MRLATILTSLLLVLGLAVMGCDSGSDDGDDTTTGGDECDPACVAGFTCINAKCVDDTSGDDDVTIPDDDTIVDPVCDPICLGKCGAIGDCDCGGCGDGFSCVEATNTCAVDVVDPPDCNIVCAGKDCGTFEGCECGVCAAGLTCNETTGMCEDICVPQCEGKQCGPDDCGGSCGLCPCVGCDPSFITCDEGTGQCVGQDELTCSEINDCMAGCAPDNQACIQDCMNKGSMEAQGQLNGLIQCLIDNGAQQCPPGDTQCQNDIITEFCMPQFEACFPAGTLSCSEVFDCMGLCAQGDQPCLQACYSDGTADAQAQYQAIATCVIEQCGEQPTEECANAAQQGACAAAFADCFNLGKPGFATGPNGGSSADYVNMKMWLMGLDKDKLYNH